MSARTVDARNGHRRCVGQRPLGAANGGRCASVSNLRDSVVLDRYGYLFPGNADPVLARLTRIHQGQRD